jgi:hypothetical membrane protein
MNVSFVAEGVLLAAGVLLTGELWRRGFDSWLARISVGLAACGYVLVGLAPADVNENLHVLGALLILGVGNAGLVFAAATPRSSPLAGVRILTMALAFPAIGATWLHLSRHYLWLGMGGTERVAVFALTVWTLALGLYVLLGPVVRRSGRRCLVLTGTGNGGPG